MKIEQSSIDNVVIFSLQGRLDYSSVDKLSKHFETALKTASTHLLLNSEKVDYIDSAGLGLLVLLLRKSEAAGKNFALCGLSPQAEKVLELTRMTRIFSIFVNQNAALKALVA